MTPLPPEIEFKAATITTKQYPHTRYELRLLEGEEEGYITIDFFGYFTESFCPELRLHPDPTHAWYRHPSVDFWVSWRSEDKSLTIYGWWRSEILSFEYSPKSQSWQSTDEENENITRPYPDGERFEAIAVELYPLFCEWMDSQNP